MIPVPMVPPGRQGAAWPADPLLPPSPSTELRPCRRRVLAWLAAGLAGTGAAARAADAGPVPPPSAGAIGSALQRPAVSTALGARSVLQGAAQAGRRLVAVGERGLILVSSDDGQSWQQRPCPVSTGLTAVRFADDLHGVAVGHGGVVLSTQDGGQQWRLVLEGLQAARLEREAARARGDAAALRSAERLVADGADKPWLDVLTSAPGRLLAVGAYGLALASGDGGLTWTSWRDRLDNPRELHLYGVRQRGERLLIAGEQGLVLLSGDGGRSFRRLVLPYAGSFFTAELPPDGSLVVAGLRGNTWRSTDGGASWQALAAPVPVSIVASALAPDGALLLASQAGQVLRAAPGELALRALPLPPQPPLTGLLPLAGGRLLTLSILGARRLSLSDAVAPAPH